jgi:type IV pilus assembly protein PilB
MPVGCPECNGTGYRGRIAVYEIMSVSKEIRELIQKNSTSGELKEHAVRNGMKTLRANCARLVLNGTTSMEEMMRVTFSKE